MTDSDVWHQVWSVSSFCLWLVVCVWFVSSQESGAHLPSPDILPHHWSGSPSPWWAAGQSCLLELMMVVWTIMMSTVLILTGRWVRVSVMHGGSCVVWVCGGGLITPLLPNSPCMYSSVWLDQRCHMPGYMYMYVHVSTWVYPVLQVMFIR